MKRPTVRDIAQHTGLSVATVDRVLHERPGVSVASRRKVREAIHTLGYGKLPGSLVERPVPTIRLAFLLPSLKTGFVRNIERAVRSAPMTVRHAKVTVEIHWTNLSEDAVVDALRKLRTFDGVGLFAPDMPEVRNEIDRLVGQGVPIVTLVSDCPASQRTASVGIDDTAAGRTVGRLMGRFLRGVKGKIGIITGGKSIRDHQERYSGFRDVLAKDYKSLSLLPLVETFSIAARNRDAVLNLLYDVPDLVGIYSVAGGNSGIISALRDANMSERQVVVTHELTDSTRRGLLHGDIDAVVDQNPVAIVRQAVRLLVAHHLHDHVAQEQEPININVFLADNVP